MQKMKRGVYKHWHYKCYPSYGNDESELLEARYPHFFSLWKLSTDSPFSPDEKMFTEKSISEVKMRAAVEYGISPEDINWWSVDSEKCKADIAKMRASGEISI